MALDRAKLLILSPPQGWKWNSRPTLKTKGMLAKDPDQGWNSRTVRERYAALFSWASENALGLSVPSLEEAARYKYVSSAYRDHAVLQKIVVTANKPELTERNFGHFECLLAGCAGHDAGELWCDAGGFAISCRSCGVAGARLWLIGNNSFYCRVCSAPCGHKGCKDRVRKSNTAKEVFCKEHDPNFRCLMCERSRPKTESVTVDPNEYPATPYRQICKGCAAKYTCPKCKKLVLHERMATTKDGKRCMICADAEQDTEREKHEKFDTNELPIHGSLLIPSLPSRPFRTISIETEVDGDGGYLARTLYRCGLVPYPRVAQYRELPPEDAEYTAFLKHDGSVTGGELIAYLLNLDDKAHAESLMDVLKRLHGLAGLKKIEHNPNCGGHIHVDAHNYGYGNIWRLLTGFNYCEDPIYRIAGAGAAYGHRTLVPGHDAANGGRGYSRSPVKGPFGSKGELGNQIRAQDRMCGLNFQPFLAAVQRCKCNAWAYEDGRNCKCALGKATIEWRVFNSTHNPRILHAWIALIQAFHAWADEAPDPTPEWEANHRALSWTYQPYNKANNELTKERLEWMHTKLPLTEHERDSLCYAISQSDMADALGADYIDGLKKLPNAADLEAPKVARNPSRRQRSIKIEPPTPGENAPNPVLQPPRFGDFNGQRIRWNAMNDAIEIIEEV